MKRTGEWALVLAGLAWGQGRLAGRGQLPVSDCSCSPLFVGHRGPGCLEEKRG